MDRRTLIAIFKRKSVNAANSPTIPIMNRKTIIRLCKNFHDNLKYLNYQRYKNATHRLFSSPV